MAFLNCVVLCIVFCFAFVLLCVVSFCFALLRWFRLATITFVLFCLVCLPTCLLEICNTLRCFALFFACLLVCLSACAPVCLFARATHRIYDGDGLERLTVVYV